MWGKTYVGGEISIKHNKSSIQVLKYIFNSIQFSIQFILHSNAGANKQQIYYIPTENLSL